jgi:hypothetical protein
MHDMILDRIFGSAGDTPEVHKRRARLAASGGAYTSEYDQRVIDHQDGVRDSLAQLMSPSAAMPAPATPGQRERNEPTSSANPVDLISTEEDADEDEDEPHVDPSDGMPWLDANPGAPAELPAEPTALAVSAALEELAAEEEPAAPEEPVAEEEPAALEEPVAEEEPAALEEPVAEEEPAAPPLAPPAPDAAQLLKDMQKQLAEQQLRMEELAKQAELAHHHSLNLQAKLNDRAPSSLAETSSAAAPMSSYEPPTRRKRPADDAASPAKAAKQSKPAAKPKGKGRKN